MDEDEGEVEQPMEQPTEQPVEPVEEKKTASRFSLGKKKSKEEKSASDLASRQQHLFLVEFLVDTVTVDPCSVDEEVLEGQTCLTLSFLNFPPMEICEKDFDPNKESGLDKVRFNCGKSLMFAFNEKQCERPPPLSVEITVSKKMGDEENTFKVDIGTIKICISELFRQIVDIAKFKPEKLPASKSIKDCFMLIGPGKRTMGEVSVYIRLSCLGQNVVTEFQCGPDMKTNPVLFKGREGKKIFEFTGNENGIEREATGSPGGKPGCGCIQSSNPQPSAFQGGQGDAGRSGGAYAKGNRVVLDIPDRNGRRGGNADTNRKSGDCQANVRQIKAKEGLTVSEVAAHPDQNCFVLRVGDKGQIPDRGKMILEFRTPKQKILPKVIPPYHEEVAVQTDSLKKGKGKKKK